MPTSTSIGRVLKHLDTAYDVMFAQKCRAGFVRGGFWLVCVIYLTDLFHLFSTFAEGFGSCSICLHVGVVSVGLRNDFTVAFVVLFSRS